MDQVLLYNGFLQYQYLFTSSYNDAHPHPLYGLGATLLYSNYILLLLAPFGILFHIARNTPQGLGE